LQHQFLVLLIQHWEVNPYKRTTPHLNDQIQDAEDEKVDEEDKKDKEEATEKETEDEAVDKPYVYKKPSAIPSVELLSKIGSIKVVSGKAELLSFSDLYSRPGTILIIFIRHFYCGMCQSYVNALAEAFTPEQLKEHNIEFHIIGCGSATLIPNYVRDNNCPFPLYADSSVRLYKALGLGKTLAGGDKKPGYQTKGIVSLSWSSIKQGLKAGGSDAFKGGDFRQLGGEYLFKDGKCVYAKKMENTRDHTEIEELKTLLDL